MDNTYNQEKIDEWTKRLSTVFNRGFWNGYYLGQRLGEWAKQHGSKATKTKVFLGKILNYYSNIGVAEIKLETDEELLVSDEIVILGPTTGVVQQFVEEIHFEQKSVKVKQAICFPLKLMNW